MRFRTAVYNARLFLLITAFLGIHCNNVDLGFTQPTAEQNGVVFNRQVTNIIYTKHALCRMDCRNIDRQEIADIIKNGEINFKKTDVNDKPCPTYALQGYASSGEHLRVIFAQCDEVTKVITCYNLEEDFACHCPGDEKKNQN